MIIIITSLILFFASDQLYKKYKHKYLYPILSLAIFVTDYILNGNHLTYIGATALTLPIVLKNKGFLYLSILGLCLHLPESKMLSIVVYFFIVMDLLEGKQRPTLYELILLVISMLVFKNKFVFDFFCVLLAVKMIFDRVYLQRDKYIELSVVRSVVLLPLLSISNMNISSQIAIALPIIIFFGLMIFIEKRKKFDLLLDSIFILYLAFESSNSARLVGVMGYFIYNYVDLNYLKFKYAEYFYLAILLTLIMPMTLIPISIVFVMQLILVERETKNYGKIHCVEKSEGLLGLAMMLLLTSVMIFLIDKTYLYKMAMAVLFVAALVYDLGVKLRPRTLRQFVLKEVQQLNYEKNDTDNNSLNLFIKNISMNVNRLEGAFIPIILIVFLFYIVSGGQS